METPDVPLALMRSADKGGMCFDPMDTTYFASRETIVATPKRGMPIWRDRLFRRHAPQRRARDGFLPHSPPRAWSNSARRWKSELAARQRRSQGRR
jgi:hypothetical protein